MQEVREQPRRGGKRLAPPAGVGVGKLLALREKVAGWLERETIHGTL